MFVPNIDFVAKKLVKIVQTLFFALNNVSSSIITLCISMLCLELIALLPSCQIQSVIQHVFRYLVDVQIGRRYCDLNTYCGLPVEVSICKGVSLLYSDHIHRLYRIFERQIRVDGPEGAEIVSPNQ